jgi:hypothetical protein
MRYQMPGSRTLTITVIVLLSLVSRWLRAPLLQQLQFDPFISSKPSEGGLHEH